jgi:CheY-like chemotaxis protein
MDLAEEATRAAELAPQAGASGPVSDPKILVAEDHPLNQLVVSIILDEAGLRFDCVEDGAAALEAMKAGGYDLVLMDVNMPRMDGLEATRRIRRLPGAAGGVPIVAVTANAAPEEVEACLQAGMDAFVAKPIRAAELLEVLTSPLQAAPALKPG